MIVFKSLMLPPVKNDQVAQSGRSCSSFIAMKCSVAGVTLAILNLAAGTAASTTHQWRSES